LGFRGHKKVKNRLLRLASVLIILLAGLSVGLYTAFGGGEDDAYEFALMALLVYLVAFTGGLINGISYYSSYIKTVLGFRGEGTPQPGELAERWEKRVVGECERTAKAIIATASVAIGCVLALFAIAALSVFADVHAPLLLRSILVAAAMILGTMSFAFYGGLLIFLYIRKRMESKLRISENL